MLRTPCFSSRYTAVSVFTLFALLGKVHVTVLQTLSFSSAVKIREAQRRISSLVEILVHFCGHNIALAHLFVFTEFLRTAVVLSSLFKRGKVAVHFLQITIYEIRPVSGCFAGHTIPGLRKANDCCCQLAGKPQFGCAENI